MASAKLTGLRYDSDVLRCERSAMAGRRALRVCPLESRYGAKVMLDLEEVTLVDVQVVRFLGACEIRGIRVLNCSPYIIDWIARERR